MNHLKLVEEAEMSRPLEFERAHRFNWAKQSIRDVSGRKKNVWNVSQNLYYNRYSLEMFCEINTSYIQEDVLEVLRFVMHD